MMQIWRDRPLALVGLSGSGKSTVAPQLARLLQWDIFDVDAAICAVSGLTAAEFFARHGEAAFRAEEARQLAIGLQQRQIVACGGGIVIAAENRARLRRQATVVWLDADDAVILRRLTQATEARPNLAGDAAARLAAQRSLRRPLYADCCTISVESGRIAPAALAQQIIRMLDARDVTRDLRADADETEREHGSD